jgi:hypothetical protein
MHFLQQHNMDIVKESLDYKKRLEDAYLKTAKVLKNYKSIESKLESNPNVALKAITSKYNDATRNLHEVTLCIKNLESI